MKQEIRARFNLKHKFVLILALPIFILGVFCSVYYFYASKHQLVGEMMKRGMFLATHLAQDAEIKGAIEIRQRAFFDAPIHNLRELDSEKELAFWRVVLTSGEVMAQGKEPWIKTPMEDLPLVDPFTVVQPIADYNPYYSKKTKERFYLFYAPVREKKIMEEEALAEQFLGMPEERQVLGTVQIGLTPEKLNKKVLKTFWVIVFPVVMAIVVGGIVISLFVTRLIVSPILTLCKATSRVASGDWADEVPVRTRDEIGLLASSFNQMTADLKKYLREKETAIEAQQKALAEARHAQELSEVKSNFLSTVSHELRTPLTSIMGFTKLIQKKFGQEILPKVASSDEKTQELSRKVAENIGLVLRESERLSRLLDDLLDLSKIEAGKVEWHMGNVRMRDVINLAINTSYPLIQAKGLSVESRYSGSECIVYGDRDRLLQVVTNLLSNAVKFTERGGITCTEETSGGTVKVSVTDTGIGIAPEDMPMLFRRFIRLSDTLADKPKGTGLGLSICKEIVEHHGGKIWAESQPGKGSTFCFTLPTVHEARGRT
jgi:signal transduction histidine kinase